MSDRTHFWIIMGAYAALTGLIVSVGVYETGRAREKWDSETKQCSCVCRP